MRAGKTMAPQGKTSNDRWITAGCLMFVIVTSFFTYFYRYESPQAPFWDEPYHIAAAQKYLHGIFFMEPHPPLGKLLIAAGEAMFGDNQKTDAFITTDYARNIPSDFSYRGVRFFPALLGWLTAPLMFWCLMLLSGNGVIAAALTSLYTFDNAQIVHSRGAMLDSTLSFTSVMTILFFLLLIKEQGKRLPRHIAISAGFGIAFALAMSTKVVALVLVLLIPLILWGLRKSARAIVTFLLTSLVLFGTVYCSIWMMHFARATKIEPMLPDAGYYQASDAYKAFLAEGTTSSLSSFPVMLRDSQRFVTHYSGGVPRLDLCKPDENGSPSFLWPIGARTISYRWERAGDAGTKYLYLVSNPVGWSIGLAGIILSLSFVIARIFGGRSTPLAHGMATLGLLSLYFGYMIAISRITRVMYLYHYFLPLLFSYLLFGASLSSIRSFFGRSIDEQHRTMIAIILGLLTFVAFLFFRPLTYYWPLTEDAFWRRSLVPSWEMVCAGCERESPLAIPKTCEGS